MPRYTKHSSPPGQVGASHHPPKQGEVVAGNLDTEQNRQEMARVMESEARGVNDEAMIVVGWALMNRMIRNNRLHVHEVWSGFAHSHGAGTGSLKLAEDVLRGTIPDPTDGVTHFYTPNRMPKKGDDTHGRDVQGGLEQVPGVLGPDNRPIQNYRPGWANSFIQKHVPSVPELQFKFYEQPGIGYVH